MTDEINQLKDSQISNMQKDNQSLQNTIRILSGQVNAMNQCIHEYLTSNINLRSSNLLLEDDVKRMTSESNMFKERIEKLEVEKKDLSRNYQESSL